MRQVLRCTLLDSSIWVLPWLPFVERIQTNHHSDEMSAAPRATQTRCPTLASSARYVRVPQVCRLTPAHHPRLKRASTPAHHPLASRVPPESVASPPLSPPPHHPLGTRVWPSLVTRMLPQSVGSPALIIQWSGFRVLGFRVKGSGFRVQTLNPRP